MLTRGIVVFGSSAALRRATARAGRRAPTGRVGLAVAGPGQHRATLDPTPIEPRRLVSVTTPPPQHEPAQRVTDTALAALTNALAPNGPTARATLFHDDANETPAEAARRPRGVNALRPTAPSTRASDPTPRVIIDHRLAGPELHRATCLARLNGPVRTIALR